jgi:hypothetical protein
VEERGGVFERRGRKGFAESAEEDRKKYKNEYRNLENKNALACHS